MSFILYTVEDESRRDVWRLSENRFKLFVGIAEIVATIHKIPSGIYHDGSPSCRIELDEFCSLVEKVFEQPSELLHPWAQHAAAIYEALKGEAYIWRWSRYQVPVEVFRPQRSADESPKKFSGQKIGSE